MTAETTTPLAGGSQVERGVRPAVREVQIDGVRYVPDGEEPVPLNGTWHRTKKRKKPERGEDVLCYWRTSGPHAPVLGVATHRGNGLWHDPEDKEETYKQPDFWMRLPPWPDEQA